MPAILVELLSKRYGAGGGISASDAPAVDSISFAVARGTTCALLGGNGAGKTTTLSMLLGLLKPTSGRALILGHDIERDRYAALPRMNFTSPYVDLPKRLTVRENLTVFARLYNLKHAADRVAELAGHYQIGELMKRPYGSLSAGQRTRVSVAKALLNTPEVLLLDEPTASLDPDAADLVRTLLAQYQTDTGATFLLASHNMPEVERLADQVLMMRNGAIVDTGSPAALIGKYGRVTLEEVFLDIARDRSAAGAVA